MRGLDVLHMYGIYPWQGAIDCRADKPLRCSCGKQWFICDEVVVLCMQIGSQLGRWELTRGCCWLCKGSACQTMRPNAALQGPEIYVPTQYILNIGYVLGDVLYRTDSLCERCDRPGLLCHRLRCWDSARRSLGGPLEALRPFWQLFRLLCQVWGTPTLLLCQRL